MEFRLKPVSVAIGLMLGTVAQMPANADNHFWVVGCAAGNRWDNARWSATFGAGASKGPPAAGDLANPSSAGVGWLNEILMPAVSFSN